jgi:hypothetical protein
MSLADNAVRYAQAAENARLDGDVPASIELAIIAAQMIQLCRLLEGKE